MNPAKATRLAFLGVAFAATLAFTISFLGAHGDSPPPVSNITGFLIQIGVLAYVLFALWLLARVLKMPKVRKESQHQDSSKPSIEHPYSAKRPLSASI